MTSPITDKNTGKAVGVILASVSTDSIEDSLHIFHTKGGAIIGMIMTIVIALAILLADCIVRPLRKIAADIEGCNRRIC